MEDKAKIAKDQCERTAKIYTHFRKSGITLNDLVEIPAMKKLMGKVKGKRILDAGCGFGYYSIYCAKEGAKVTGIDISETMIALAQEEAARAGVQIDFQVKDATDLRDFQPEQFDMAISSVAGPADIPAFFLQMARVLRPGGVFCFSEVHPLLGGSVKVSEGNTTARIVDHYFDRGTRKVQNPFGKINTTDENYEWVWEHLTLSDYCDALQRAGFLIENLLEPEPDPDIAAQVPGQFQRAFNFPIFFLIRAVKRSGS